MFHRKVARIRNPRKDGVKEKGWQLVLVLLCASMLHKVKRLRSEDYMNGVPTVCWVPQRASYSVPGTLHKVCLLCARFAT